MSPKMNRQLPITLLFTISLLKMESYKSEYMKHHLFELLVKDSQIVKLYAHS